MARRGTCLLHRLGLAVALGIALCAPAQPQATTQISNVRIPVDLDPDLDGAQTLFDDPCQPEPLLLDGTLHIVVKSTIDARGILHLDHTHNPQGVRAVGEV